MSLKLKGPNYKKIYESINLSGKDKPNHSSGLIIYKPNMNL